MDFRSFLKDNTVFLDGGMGTLLQKKGILGTEVFGWISDCRKI